MGKEIPRRMIRLMLNKMCEKGILFMEGVKATAKYALDKNR